MNKSLKAAMTILLGLDGVAFAADTVNSRRIPDEYESTGGHSLGMGNSASVAVGGISAVRLNPAMLPMEKTYSVSAGYNWPVSGRDFYQAGVVDSKTAAVAAGVSYTSYMDDYVSPGADPSRELVLDSPIKRRVAAALAQTFKLVSLGAGGQYIQAYDMDSDVTSERGKEISGTTLSLGAAALLNPQVRVGLSAENLANKKMAEFAPKTYRAGGAYIFGGGDVTLHLDYRQRERVAQFEGAVADTGDFFGVRSSENDADNAAYQKPEQMVTASCSARIQDYLRLMGAYGQSLGADDRRTLAGGLAVVSNKMSLSYTASRPYLPVETAHHSINLSIEMSM